MDDPSTTLSTATLPFQTAPSDAARTLITHDPGATAPGAPPTTTRRPAVFPPPSPQGGASPLAPASERYEVVRPLGEGSFGEVELVQDHDIQRYVARKRLKPELLYGDVLERFAREVRLVGALEHPSIAPVHDVGLDDRGYFFVMKYIEGVTLEDLIERLKAGDPALTSQYTHEARARLFLQVVKALQFAHARGVIHRDLKPANIMVGRWGEVFVLDWGIARKLDQPDAPPEPPGPTADPWTRGTAAGELIGTPAYMAPEQARGDQAAVDERSDLYALCAVFYELLTLDYYLTEHATVEATLAAVLTEEPRGAVSTHHRYGVPPELAFLIRKGLSKDPAERYQHAGELIARVEAAMEGHAPVQCPCTGLKRAGGSLGDFIDRHPILAVLTAIVVAGLTLHGGVQVVLSLAGALQGR